MFLVLGLRNAVVGVDLVRYSLHYEYLENVEDVGGAFRYSALNPAFWLLNYVVTQLGIPFQGFISLVAAICVSCIVYFVYRNSSAPLLTFFCLLGMGFFTFLFSGLKQSLAMSTALIFFDVHLRDRIKASLFWLVLSIMFHWASIVLIPMFFIGKMKMTRSLVFVYIIAFVFLLLFSRFFGEAITSLMVEGYVGHYKSTDEIGGIAIFSLVISVLYVFLVYHKKSSTETYFLHGLVILCMIQLCSSYAYAFTRLNLFYMGGIMSVVVSMLGNKDNIKKTSILYSSREIVTFGFSLLWVLVMIHLFWTHIESENLGDYMFCWQK
jgi:transmembrane protein EpsG